MGNQNQRSEGVRELVHELRGPLTALAAIGELLDGPVRDDVLDVVAHMRVLLSRADDRQPVTAGGEVPMGAAIGRSARMVVIAEEGLMVDIDCQPGLVALGDPYAITQILVNLLANAARHSPRGQSILIRARRIEGSVVVDVCDRGPGVVIGEDAFLPGVSGDPQRTGIGLAVGRRLAEEMGGRLDLGPQDGGGCLVLTLPGA